MSDAAPSFDARALTRLGRVTSLAPSPCGTWLAVAVERLDADEARYASDLWRVPVDGGPAARLTVGDSRDRAPCFRADGALGFLSDRPRPGASKEDADDARSQVWLLPAAGGEPRPVTDEPLGVSDFRFAAAGDRLVVLADVLRGVPHGAQREVARERKRRGPSAMRYQAMPVRYWDHWHSDAEPHLVAYAQDGSDRRDLTPDAGLALHETAWDLAPDGSLVVAAWATLNPIDRSHDRPLALLPTDGGPLRLAGVGVGVVHAAPRFSPDSGRVAVTRYTRTPLGYGHKSLWTYDTAADAAPPRELTAAWDGWPSAWGWTPDGTAVLATADCRGQHPMLRVDVASGAVTRLTPASLGGVHASVVALPGRPGALVAIRSTLLAPPEAFLFEGLERGEALPRPLARLSGMPEGLGAGLARVRDVLAAVGDGRTVQTFIVEPVAPPPGPTQAFLWIHGGPVAAWSDGWHWRWSPLVLAAAGYTVVLPNPAGSTGFGQAWVDDIWGNTWGARCYEDLMGLAEVLEFDEEIAPSDLVIMGGSFGGYMTNWIGSSTDRFKRLVSHAGIFSMSSFYGVTDRPAWWLLMMGDTPYRDSVGFDRYAPLRKVAHWRTPTLVTHGERDYRVPIGESLALFEALDYHEVPAELLVFPDEHHWILKPRNTIAWYDAVLDFVARGGPPR